MTNLLRSLSISSKAILDMVFDFSTNLAYSPECDSCNQYKHCKLVATTNLPEGLEHQSRPSIYHFETCQVFPSVKGLLDRVYAT